MFKKILFIALLFCLTGTSFSQQWSHSGVITGSNNIEPRYSCLDNMNNLIVFGTFSGSILSPFMETSFGTGNDLVLMKYNSSGSLIWYKHIGSPSTDVCAGVTIDESNSIYISGNYQGSFRFDATHTILNTGSNDAFLAKYSANGDLQWASRICGAQNNQGILDLKYVASSNELVMTGYFIDSLIIGNQPSNYDTIKISNVASAFISTFNLNGSLTRVRNFEQTYAFTRINKVAVSSEGFYFSGNYRQNLYLTMDTLTSMTTSGNDAFIYKTDLNLQGEWIRNLRGSLSDNISTILSDKFENVYFLGTYTSPVIYLDSTSSDIISSTGSTSSSDVDTYIGKYNRSGVLQWYVKKGGVGSDYYNDFVLNNNMLYATGYFADRLIFNNDTLRTSSTSNQDPFLGLFNDIGDPIGGISIVGSGNYLDGGSIVNGGTSSQAFVSGYFRSPQITIGTQTYTHPNPGTSNLFYAIYQHPLEAVIIDENMVSCNGLADGMLTATGYFGRPPYTYSWSHNATLNNPVATGLSPGTYTVTIRDQDNNIASVTHDITQPAPINIDGVVTQVTCFNGETGAINITVTGGNVGTYDYRWSALDGSGIIPVNEDQLNLSSGTYRVEVTDANLCTANRNFIVAEPAQFDYTGSFATPITSPPGGNGAVTINLAGGNLPYKTYRWDGPSGYSANTEDITLLNTPGLYYFTLTDAKDCVSDTSFAVLDNITFIAQITSKTDVTCKDEDDGTAAVTVYNATGQVTYAWSGFAPTTNNTIANMPPGKYTMVATDGGGHSATDTITIFEPRELFLFPLDKIDPLCNGDNKGVVNLTLTGGTLPYTYNWNNGYYSGEDLVNVSGGTYTVQVTDANNCTGSKSIIVIEPAAIGLFITIEDEILCNGENTAVALAHGSGGTPAGSFTYLWDDPGTQITPYAYELVAGNYTVTITDNNGCSQSSSVNIDEPNPLSITVLINNPSCPGDDNGSIIPTPSGGTGTGYEYIWSNNVFQRFNTDLSSGQYILTLNDANGCILIDTFDLVDPEPLTIASVTPTDPTCTGLNDGSIAITAAGGTGAYEYSLDGGITFDESAIIGSIPQGDYFARVRDANQCVSGITPISLTLSETCGLIIYDAFSPNNGDDLNNEWIIENAVNFPEIKVTIFNIWGVEVFASTGYEEPWDGTYNGKELPSGTYYYVIDPGDGSKTLSGPVNIVK